MSDSVAEYWLEPFERAVSAHPWLAEAPIDTDWILARVRTAVLDGDTQAIDEGALHVALEYLPLVLDDATSVAREGWSTVSAGG